MGIDTVLLDSIKKNNKLVDQIIADKKYHKKELLQPVIDAMDELIQLAEEKLEIFLIPSNSRGLKIKRVN